MEKILKNSENQMNLAVNAFESELKKVKAGRISPSILDRIMVDYYGTPTPILQVATVSVSESRILIVQPWDVSCFKNIQKALQGANLGVNPQNDGKVIRLVFPQITEEQRKVLAKDIARLAETYKVQVRNIRRDSMEKLKKMKKNLEIAENNQIAGEKRVQKLTDDFSSKIDSLLNKKREEIMTV